MSRNKEILWAEHGWGRKGSRLGAARTALMSRLPPAVLVPRCGCKCSASRLYLPSLRMDRVRRCWGRGAFSGKCARKQQQQVGPDADGIN